MCSCNFLKDLLDQPDISNGVNTAIFCQNSEGVKILSIDAISTQIASKSFDFVSTLHSPRFTHDEFVGHGSYLFVRQPGGYVVVVTKVHADRAEDEHVGRQGSVGFLRSFARVLRTLELIGFHRLGLDFGLIHGLAFAKNDDFLGLIYVTTRITKEWQA
jgi:hypothetical protein